MENILKKGNVEIGVYSKGAELYSYKVDGKEFMWERNPEFWGSSSPILFPFVGVIKNGNYEYSGKHYELKTRHGFARDNIFELSGKGENFIEFKFSSNEKTLEIYPFKFELYIKYTIIDDMLEIQYKVINNSDEKMYFSIGAHPAFALEINEKINLEDYYIELEQSEKAKRIPLKENGLAFEIESSEYFLDEKDKIKLNGQIFDEDAIIFENLKSQIVMIKCEKSTRKVEIDYKDFPFIAFWSKPGASFVCIEPWYGITDFENSTGKLEDKKGIQKLDKNSEFRAKFTIKANL